MGEARSKRRRTGWVGAMAIAALSDKLEAAHVYTTHTATVSESPLIVHSAASRRASSSV